MVVRTMLLSVILSLLLGTVTGCGKKMTDEEILQAATEFNSREEFDKAVTMHQQLLEEYPESPHYPKSLFMVGFIYANHIKKLEKAEQVFKEFLQKYPDHELAPSVKWELEHLGQEDVGTIIQEEQATTQ